MNSLSDSIRRTVSARKEGYSLATHSLTGEEYASQRGKKDVEPLTL